MAKSSAVALDKMSALLASKGAAVQPAIDAVQRGTNIHLSKDEKTKSSNDDVVNLSFKVPAAFRKRFKQAALDAGVTQNELVQRALSVWEAQDQPQ